MITLASFRIQPHLEESFAAHPWGYVFSLSAILGIIGIRVLDGRRNGLEAFLCSGLFILGMLTSTAFGIYPYVLPLERRPCSVAEVLNAAAPPDGLRFGLKPRKLPEANSAIAAAKANLDLAQATFGRMQDLFQRKSISNQEFDEASARLKAAQAAYEMVQSRRAQLNSKLAQVDQEVRSTEVMRSYADVLAPFAGVITAKSVEPGSLALPGTPLLTIEREGAYRLEASAEESHLAAIRVGQPVSVTLDSVDRTLNARVSEIAPAVDPASRAYTVKVDLPALPSLRSGVFGRAAFQLSSRSLLAVPAGAVTERGQLQSILVADNGIARTRLITTGQKVKDRTEVLSGLTTGERVIFPIPEGLTDGARVEVRP